MAEGDADVGDRAREGLDHLQAAAKEMIAAARAMLDAAEHMVEDPQALSTLMGMFGSVARLAGDVFTGRGAGDDDDDDPGVQPIRVR